jgi:hypothetical protein
MQLLPMAEAPTQIYEEAAMTPTIFSRVKSLILILALAFALMPVTAAHAAEFFSVQSGDWNDPATWGGAEIPTAADSVTIATGHTVTIDADAEALNVTINNGGGLNGGSSMLTIYGAFAMENADNFEPATGTIRYGGEAAQGVALAGYYNLILSNSNPVAVSEKTLLESIIVDGSLTVQSEASLIIPAYIIMVDGSTIVEEDGAIRFTEAGGTKIFGDVTIQSGGEWDNTGNSAVTFNGSLENNGVFISGTGLHTFSGTDKTLVGEFGISNVTISGSYTNQGSLTIATALAGAGSLTQGGGSALTLGMTSITLPLVLDAATNENTVTYNRAGSQTVKSVAYRHLVLEGSGAKSLSGVSTIHGNFSINGAATSSTGANLTIGGNLTLDSSATTPFSVGAHDITVHGTTTILSGKLEHASSLGAKTYKGDVTIYGTWDGNKTNPDPSFTFEGSFINNGSVDAGSGVYTFAGENKNISGTNLIDIDNATINGSYTNTGSLTVGIALSGSGSLTQAADSMLDLVGDVSLNALDASATGNTVSYTKSGNQTVVPILYHHLKLGGTGTTNVKTTSDVTVKGTLTMMGTATVSGAITYGPDAELFYSKGSTAGTVGAEWVSPFSATGGVTIGGTGKITLNGNKVLDAPFTTLAGSSFDTAGFNITVNDDMSTGGTFKGNASVIAVTGNFVHSAGTFTADSMTLHVDGDFSNAGTFNANSMTLTVGGNLVNASTFAAGTMAADVSGNFSHNTGTFTATSMMLTVGGDFQNNATFTATVTALPATLKLSGDFLNAGTIGGTPTFNMILEGVNDQSVSGFITTGALTMQKSGGTATLQGNVTTGKTDFTGDGLIMNGAGGTLHLGDGLSHTVRGTWVRTMGAMYGGSSLIKFQGATPANGSGGSFDPGTGTVQYDNNATHVIPNITYYNLILSRRSSGTPVRTLEGNLIVFGALDINSSTTLDVSTHNMTVDGETKVNSGGKLKFSTVAGVKTFKGMVTITGTWDNAINSPVTFNNGLMNNGTLTAGMGVYTFSVNDQSIAGTKATTIPNVLVDGVTLTNAVGTAPGLTISASLGGSGTLAQGENIALVLGGTTSITGLNASANGNTVTYNLAGAQALKPTVYHNLTLSGGGNKPLTGISTITGKLLISGVSTTPATTATGAHLTVGSIDISSYSTFTVGNHSLSVNGAVDIRNTASITQTFAPIRNRQFGGLVTVYSGGTWTNSDNNNTFLGGLSNSGTFNAGIGKHLFKTNDQTISGTKATAFFHIEVDGVTVTNANTLGITLLAGGGTFSTINGGVWLQGVNSILNIGVANINSATIDASTNLNTVNYNMAGAQTIKITDYRNLTLSGSGVKTLTGLTSVSGNLTFAGVTTTTIPSTLTAIGGNLTLNNTAIATLASDLTVNGTVTVSASSSAGKLDLGAHTLTVKGNWSKGTGTVVTTGSVIFNGAGNHTLSGSSSSIFQNLVINKVGDLKFTASKSPVINGTLTLTEGTVTTGARIVIIGKNGSISGGNASSFIIGNLRKIFPAGIGPQTFTYHLGDVNGYRPMTIINLNVTAPTAGTGYITATVPNTPTEHAQIASSNIQQTKNVNRYWTLTTGGSIKFTGAYSVTFGFENDHYDAGANPLGFFVKRYQNSTSPVGWSDSTLGSRSVNSITASNFTSIGSSSNFVVGELLGTTISPVTISPAKTSYQYGEAVTMSATLVTTGSSTPLSGKAIVFEFDGRVVGSANTNSSGVATINALILADVGAGKRLTARYEGDGAKHGFSTGQSVEFEVTKRLVQLTATSASKVYDGGVNASTTPTLTSGTLMAGDTLIQVFADKNVGSGKEVIPGVDDGNNGENYEITVNNPGNTLGTITPKPLTITGVSAQNKTYDGTTDANLTGIPGLGGVVGGDLVTVTGNPSTGSFANKHVGAGKTVTPASAYTIDNPNYTVTQPTFTASISKANITLNAVPDTKAYDGTTSSDETPTVDGGTLMPGDTVFQTFDTRDVGTGKTLTPSVNDGNNGNNYNITANTVSNGEITKMTITVTPNDAIGYLHPTNNAPYPLTLTFTAVGFGDGDSFNSPGFTAPTCETDVEFNNDNYPASVSPYADVISCSGGVVSDNYDLVIDNDDKGDLTVLGRILLTITAQNQTITYGDAAPAYTFTAVGFEDGDDESNLTALPTCSSVAGPFNAGAYPITCSGGVDNGNKYAFSYISGTLTVEKKAITVTANPQTISNTLPAAYTFTYSDDFVNSDTAVDIDTPPTCAPSGAPYVVGVNAGKIVCSSGVDNNYSFNYLPGNLTIQTIVMTFVSSAAQDGWTLESGESTNKGGAINTKATQFFVGDDAANKQYRGILSFNTSPLPDNAVITAASLKLRYGGTVGGMTPSAMMTNFKGFQVDVKNGTFGKATLEKADFQTKATKTVASKPKLVSKYYTINLTTAGTAINKLATGSGLTQIRIRFKLDDNNNATANYLKLYSGNISNVAYKPQLIVTYHLVP